MTLSKPQEVLVKGTTFTSTLRFIEERHGADGLAKVIDALNESDRALVKGGIADKRFHPFQVLVHIMQASKRLNHGPEDYYFQMGRASADYAMGIFLKALFKVATPEYVINQAAVFYGSFYTSGRIRVINATKGSASILLDRFAEPCPEFCLRVHGWATRISELAGAKELVSEKVACVCNGDPACRIDNTWTM